MSKNPFHEARKGATSAQGLMYDETMYQFEKFWEWLHEHIPPGRYLAIAINDLEHSAAMAVNAVYSADDALLVGLNRSILGDDNVPKS